MSVPPDLVTDTHMCPYCDATLSEESRQEQRLHQFEQGADAVLIIDLMLRCPVCNIRIHKRVRAI